MGTGFSSLQRRLLAGALLIALLSSALGSAFWLHRRYQGNAALYEIANLGKASPQSLAHDSLGKDLELIVALYLSFSLGSALGMVLMVQKSLLRHLRDLGNHLALPGKESLAPFALKRRPSPKPDELDELVGALNAHGQNTRALLDQERHLRLKQMQRQAHLDRLLHALSHDLRQPLFTMDGCVEELSHEWRAHMEENPETASLLGLLKEANQMISARVAALERLLRIRSRELQPTDLDIQALDALLHSAMPAGHEACFIIGPLCPLRVDREALREICVELFSNSVRAASPERPLQVLVSAQASGGSSSLYIEDNGKGMPLTDLDKLELLFYKSDPGRLGLGIATCRALAESLGGSLSFKAPPSGGLLTTLELPN